MARNFGVYIPVALLLAIGITFTCILLCKASDQLPRCQDMLIIAGGCLLIAGAMSVAYAEKKLYSEHAYQYRTMHALFSAADQRLTAQIGEFAKAESQGDQERLLDEIQAAIFELGLEALDENAEWLILHRARPLEPVMAG